MWWLLSLLATAAEPIAAVGTFDVHASDPALAPVGSALADMLLSDLGAADVRLVERARLQEVLAELQLQQTDLVDPASAAKLGRLLGASWIVTGAATESGGVLRLDARVVDVETAEIVATASREGPPHALFATERALALALLDALGLSVDAELRARLGDGGPPPGAPGRGFDPAGPELVVTRKGLMTGGTLWVDGVAVGKPSKSGVATQVVAGPHELALALGGGKQLLCWGVFDVPAAGAAVTTQDLCRGGLSPGYGPHGTVLRGGILAVRAETAQGERIAVQVEGYGFVPDDANLNLSAGTYSVQVTKEWEVRLESGARRTERETVCAVSAAVERGVTTVLSASVAGCSTVQSLVPPGG